MAVTGAVYVGAEIADNWDEISAATEQAAEWTTDQAVKAAAWVGDQLDDIDDVVPELERNAFMAGYKAAAGFAIEQLNTAPATIPAGARLTDPVDVRAV